MTKKFLANDPNFLSTEVPAIVFYLELLGFKKEIFQRVGKTQYLTDDDWPDEFNSTSYVMTLGKVSVKLQQCEHERYSDFSDQYWSTPKEATKAVKKNKKTGYSPTAWEVTISTLNEKCDGHLYTIAKEERYVEPTDVDGLNAAIRTTINRCNEKIDHHRKRYADMLDEADEIQKTYDILL